MSKVRLIVGVYRADLGDDHVPSPVIAGCIDYGTWEIISSEESDEWSRELRRKFDPAEADYEWREVIAEFDPEVLKGLFSTSEVLGTLVPSDGQQMAEEPDAA